MFKIKKKQLNEVAIILPNFNSYNFIKETIKSVTSQTYKNWKLYIVDDASNQKTKNLLKSYEKNKKIKIFFLKKNKGAGFCRNLAIEKSHSKYIAFIDSDDIWARNKLKLQIKFMEQNDHNFTYTYYTDSCIIRVRNAAKAEAGEAEGRFRVIVRALIFGLNDWRTTLMPLDGALKDVRRQR